MKTIWLSLALFLAAVAPALALQVTGTFPPANSESFTTADTLRVVFSNTPPAINDNNVLIQGRNGSYGVDRYEIRGDTALIFPRNYWIVGDEVRVVISSQIVNPPYYFSFTIHVPCADPDPRLGRHILRYDDGIPMDMAGTDVDGDGKVDLAILFTDSLGVVQNVSVEGAERFDPNALTWTDGGHPACDARRSLRAADMNHDGLPELMITDPIRNLLTVYHNTSAGGVISFADTTQVALQLVHPTDVQLADFNGDGNVDIAVIGQGLVSGQVMVLLNMGLSGGRFTFAPYTFATGLTPTGLAVADVNLDRLPELVVACFGSQSVEMFTVTPLPFGLHRDTVVSGLASGPDGLIVNNVAPYWDNLGGQQLPDIFIWSQGLHAQAAMNRGRRALDEEPYLMRVQNLGNGTFGPPDLLTGLPGQFQIIAATAGTLDPYPNSPDQNWMVLGRSLPNGNWQIYRSSDQLDNWTEFSDPDALQSPYLPLLFDLDEDGDLDYFFIDHQPGEERIVYYYRTQVCSHPDTACVDFGTCPINGTEHSLLYPYVNETPYPQIVQSVYAPPPYRATVNLPVTLPDTLGVGDSLGITYGFRPPVDQDYLHYYATIYMEGMIDTVPLCGTGGRSIIQVRDSLEHVVSGDTLVDTLWFGNFPPDTSARRCDSIHLHNLGNYPLAAHYLTGEMVHFQFNPPVDTETVQPYDSGLVHPICFTPPSGIDDSTYVECFEVYDLTFAGADWWGPRNILIRDTVRVCLKARVLNNHLPEDSCPTLQLREGDSGTMFIPVYDPDDSPHQPVWCDYDETSPTGPLTVTGGDTVGGPRSQINLTYRVLDNVNPPGQTCILRFELKDNQYPDSSITRACTLWIANVNDRPVITVTPIVVQETELVDRVIATVTDEEHDAIRGDAGWLQSGRTAPVVPIFDSTAGEFRLDWQTDCDDEGLYVAELRVWELNPPDPPADTVCRTVSVLVLDTPPDLAVENLRTEPGVDTVNRRTAVTVKFDVRETRSICPVSDSFQVQLWHDSGAGLTKTLISRWETSLPAGNTLHFQSGPLELVECATHTFRAVILPSRPDSLASNNRDSIEAFVRCPDLWAKRLTCPSVLHKWNPYCLSATIQETTGIPVDSEFCVTITDNGHEFWRRCFPGLGGGDSIQVDSICPDPTGVLGEHMLYLCVLPPPGQDVNASNNCTWCSMLVVGDPFHAHPLPFTPNGDGYNDTLYFDFGDEKYENGPVVCIFDLAGRLIVELDQVSNKAIPWNGRDRHDAECVPGPYFYTFTNGDQKVSSGLVYVAR